MIEYISIINFNVADKLFSMISKYPIRIILICVGLFFVLKCIKRRFLLSAGVMVIALALLIVVTFTDVLTLALKDIPITIQYMSIVVFTILYCVIFDYESSRN